MEVEFHLDPLSKFENYTPDDIMDVCGFIPQWLVAEELIEYDALTALDKAYQWGPLTHLEKSVVNEDGSYSYPGDPDMYPLIIIKRGKDTVIQYQYGMVAIKVDDKPFVVTRMD